MKISFAPGSRPGREAFQIRVSRNLVVLEIIFDALLRHPSLTSRFRSPPSICGKRFVVLFSLISAFFPAPPEACIPELARFSCAMAARPALRRKNKVRRRLSQDRARVVSTKVIDDWPASFPVSDYELRVIETHLNRVLEELLGPLP